MNVAPTRSATLPVTRAGDGMGSSTGYQCQGCGARFEASEGGVSKGSWLTLKALGDS
jgi:hypothetical protein